MVDYSDVQNSVKLLTALLRSPINLGWLLVSCGSQIFRSVITSYSIHYTKLYEVEREQQKWSDAFFGELASGRLIPAGRILANARPDSPMKNYNNCFTIDIEDSMEGIYESLKEDAAISKMGGGVGFDISKLRPKGAPLSSGSCSSGVISFLRIFDQSAKTIMTGGQRRSAHIALLDISRNNFV